MSRGVVLAALLGALLPAPHLRAGDVQANAFAHLSLPGKIGTLEYDKQHEFEDSELGVSVGYRGRGQILTLYFYNFGLPGIPDGIDNEVVREHYEQVKGDVTGSDAYTEVNVRHEGVARLAEGPTASEVLEAEFRIVREDGSVLSSYLMLTAAKGMFVKVRYSCSEGTELEATGNRNAILKTLNDLLPTIRMTEQE